MFEFFTYIKSQSPLIVVPVGFTLIGIVLFEAVKLFLQRHKKKIYADAWSKTSRTFIVFFAILGFFVGAHIEALNALLVESVDFWFSVVFVLFSAYFIIQLFDNFLYTLLKHAAKKTKTKLDDMLLPLVKRLFSVIVWVIAISIVLSKFGYNVTALVAGFGIGGLAIAFASKQIIENLFGGIVIMLDKVFEVGDRISVKGVEGEVDGISLRSTIVKKDDGTIAIIPNSIILGNVVERKKEEGKQ